MLAAPVPLHFPESEDVSESKLHLDLRTALYSILKLAFEKEHSIGCDQFVYWNPQDPKECLSPDGFVKLGVPDERFPVWKVWERGGPPDVAVEIVSPTDKRRWRDKFADYHVLGVRELVRYDADGRPGSRLEVWDLRNRKLVPRKVVGETAESGVLSGLRWVLAPISDRGLEIPLALRLARADGSLLPTPVEDADAEIARLRAELDAMRK